MEIHVETRSMKGESANGDFYLVHDEQGIKFLCVIDGLGHGPLASEASTKAAGLLKENADMDLNSLFEVVGKELRQTRGVAVSVLKFDTVKETLEYGGIGNVETFCTNKEIKPISYGGVLGHHWRRPKVFKYEYGPGDIFVVFSDGVSTRFDIHDYEKLDCERMAKKILQEHGKDHDDATVMVIKA